MECLSWNRRMGITAWIVLCCSFLRASPLLAADISDEHLRNLERKVWTHQDPELLDLENEIVREIQINPRQAYAFYLLAHLNMRRFTQTPDNLIAIKVASELAQQAIELEPTKDFGYIALAEALDTMGQTDRAIQLLGHAATLGVEPTWRHYFTLARLHAQQTSQKQILGYLEQALAFKDSEPEVIIPYVVAVLQTNQEDDALLDELYSWDQKFSHDLFKQTIAMTLADQGKFEKAHILYQSIYRKRPQALEAKINDGILLYTNMQRPSESIKLLGSVLEQEHTNHSISATLFVMVRAHLASAMMRSHDQERAEVEMLKAIKSTQDQTLLLDFALKSFRTAHQAQRLPAFINKLTTEIMPTGVLYALLGESLSEDAARHEEAVKSFANAILLEPNRSEYYNGMGLAFFRLQKLEKALDLFKEASRIDPTDATAMYNGACALARLGRAKESLGSLQQAIQLDPQLVSHARQDADLKSLFQMNEFKQILADAERGPTLDQDGDEVITGH